MDRLNRRRRTSIGARPSCRPAGYQHGSTRCAGGLETSLPTWPEASPFARRHASTTSRRAGSVRCRANWRIPGRNSSTKVRCASDLLSKSDRRQVAKLAAAGRVDPASSEDVAAGESAIGAYNAKNNQMERRSMRSRFPLRIQRSCGICPACRTQPLHEAPSQPRPRQMSATSARIVETRKA